MADADVSADAADDRSRPLPPYPSTVGHPLTHTFRTMRDVFGFRDRALANHDVVRVRFLGPGDVYHLAHPDHFERVLLNDRDDFRKSEDFRVAFDEGLVAVEGETWRQQRTTLQPMFGRDAILDYADGMVDQIRRRCRRWETGSPLDLPAETRELSLDVLFATLFGRELDVDGDEDIRRAADRLHHWFAPTSYPLPRWIPTPARLRFRRGKRRLRRVAADLLTEKADDPPTDPASADDLLSLLVGLREAGLADETALSDERLRDQVVTMIFAGHDTTSTAIAFAFYALATNPDVRKRFHAEIDGLDGPPGVDTLDDLEVTERVVTEALRLYPPVYTIPREAATDLEMAGYRIPSGSPVWLAVEQVHRDPRFFDDPGAFRPSRWATDLHERLPDFAYVPFGGGPRRCIGRQFALVEAQLALATIGREYALEWPGTPPDDAPLTPGMTARMDPGTTFRVVPR